MADEPDKTIEPVKKPRKTPIKPKHRAVLREMTTGKPITEAMIAVGYKPTVAKTPSNVTRSKSWLALMDEYLPEESLTELHRTLLNSSVFDTQTFPITMTDQQIRDNIEALGYRFITIEYTDKTTKKVYFSKSDTTTVTRMIEMAYKLRGRFGEDKAPVQPQTVYALFYKPEIQAQLKTFEDTLKQTIINESIREAEIVDREQTDTGGPTS